MKNRLNYSKILLKAQKYLSDGILIFDAKGSDIKLVFVNKGVSNILGFTNKELIGKNPSILENKDAGNSSIKKIRDAFANNHNCTTDLFITKKNGENIFCRIVITAIPDSEGNADAFVCIVRDITEMRKNLLNDLKLSVVESTLSTINDIVFNYMNNTQLFRMHCEEKNIIDKDVLLEWDKSHETTLKKLKRLNELKEFKEKKLGERLTMIKLNN